MGKRICYGVLKLTEHVSETSHDASERNRYGILLVYLCKLRSCSSVIPSHSVNLMKVAYIYSAASLIWPQSTEYVFP